MCVRFVVIQWHFIVSLWNLRLLSRRMNIFGEKIGISRWLRCVWPVLFYFPVEIVIRTIYEWFLSHWMEGFVVIFGYPDATHTIPIFHPMHTVFSLFPFILILFHFICTASRNEKKFTVCTLTVIIAAHGTILSEKKGEKKYANCVLRIYTYNMYEFV